MLHCPNCGSTDIKGYWMVQVSSDVAPDGTAVGGLETDVKDILRQMAERPPEWLLCHDCDYGWAEALSVDSLEQYATDHRFRDSEAEDSFERGLAAIKYALRVESALAPKAT